MRAICSLSVVATSVVAVAFVLATAHPSSLTVDVPAGGNLQQAINAARPGDTIFLEPGALYVGNFLLPARIGDDTRPIVIRTSGRDPVPQGERITPASAALLAKIQSSDVTPALRTSPGTRFWRVELVEFLANRGGQGDIITLGDGSGNQKSLNDVPSDLTLDRIYVHGDPRVGQKRGVALNSIRTTITGSYFSDIKAVGQDSQAIAGWNGPGDYLIENNYLEAAGENVIFGGSDPAIPGLTTTNVIIRGNTLSKPLVWRQPGSPWQVKNLFELKNARNVVVERNLLERNWQAAQSGYSILFTVRNQDGGCPWCQVEHVQFRQNIIRDVAAGVVILGFDYNHPSLQTNDIVIRNNVFDGIDNVAWDGDGSLLLMTDRPRDIIIDHNTVIQKSSNGVAKIDGQVEGFVFTNNIASHGAYGIIASDHGVGNDSIRFSLPHSVIRDNVLAGGNSHLYPAGNLFPSLEEFRSQFVDFDRHDYRLMPSSLWVRAGSDGRNLGADLSAMTQTPIPSRAPRIPIP